MSDQPHPLADACWAACFKEGNLDKVRECLDAGAGIDQRAPCSGSLPLDAALWGWHFEIARYLVDRGADVNGVGYDDYTVFMAACRTTPEMVALLLHHGADPNLPSPRTGETPLHAVTGKGFEKHATEIVRMLLEAGAKPNVTTKSGAEGCVYPGGSFYHLSETPLHLAAAFGDAEMMRMLVAAGADIHAKDDNGHTPYNWYGRHQRTFAHIEISTEEKIPQLLKG